MGLAICYVSKSESKSKSKTEKNEVSERNTHENKRGGILYL